MKLSGYFFLPVLCVLLKKMQVYLGVVLFSLGNPIHCILRETECILLEERARNTLPSQVALPHDLNLAQTSGRGWQ